MQRNFEKFIVFLICNCLISLFCGFGRAYCDEFQCDSILIAVLERVGGRTYFSRDSRYLINKYTPEGVKNENCFRIWSIPEFEEIKTLTEEDDWVADIVCCSPDGKYLMSANTDKSVSAWKLPEVSEVKRIKFPKKVRKVINAHFSPDGQYCAAMINYNVKYGDEDESAIIVWQVSNWKEIKTFKENKKYMDEENLKFLPDNTLCHGKSDYYRGGKRGWINEKAWRLPNFKSVKCLKKKLLNFSENGKCLAICEKRKISIRQISNFKEIGTLKLPEEKYRNIVISNDGQYLVIRYGNYIELYKAPYTEEPNVLRISGLRGVEFALNSKYLLARREYEKNDKVWRLSDLGVRELLKEERYTFSPDGRYLVNFYEETSIIKDTVGTKIKYLTSIKIGIKIRYESDFFDEGLVLYSNFLSFHSSRSFCFSPDGRYLAVTDASNDKIYILQVPKTKENLKELASKTTLEKAKEEIK